MRNRFFVASLASEFFQRLVYSRIGGDVPRHADGKTRERAARVARISWKGLSVTRHQLSDVETKYCDDGSASLNRRMHRSTRKGVAQVALRPFIVARSKQEQLKGNHFTS